MSWAFFLAAAVVTESPGSQCQNDINAQVMLHECRSIGNNKIRLACYDNLAAKNPIASGPNSGKNGWKFDRSVSEIDDTETLVIRLGAEGHLEGWPGKQVRPILVVRCKPPVVDTYVITGMTGSGDTTSVAIRLDKKTPTKKDWINSRTGEEIFYPSGVPGVLRFVNELMNHSRLIFQIEPLHSNPTTTSFHIDGIADAIRPLQQSCYFPTELQSLGLRFVSHTSENAKKHGLPKLRMGPIVSAVDPNGMGAAIGISVGDMVTVINGLRVRTPEEILAAEKKALLMETINMEVWTAMNERIVTF